MDVYLNNFDNILDIVCFKAIIYDKFRSFDFTVICNDLVYFTLFWFVNVLFWFFYDNFSLFWFVITGFGFYMRNLFFCFMFHYASCFF